MDYVSFNYHLLLVRCLAWKACNRNMMDICGHIQENLICQCHAMLSLVIILDLLNVKDTHVSIIRLINISTIGSSMAFWRMEYQKGYLQWKKGLNNMYILQTSCELCAYMSMFSILHYSNRQQNISINDLPRRV